MKVVTKLALTLGRQWHHVELAVIGDCAAPTAERSSDPLGASASAPCAMIAPVANDKKVPMREIKHRLGGRNRFSTQMRNDRGI